MPDLSVIVPARDSEATLARTLEAVAAQEVDAAVEVVVVDDGSTDGTRRVAEAHGVRCLTQPPAGPGAARNRGVRATSAPLLAFTDSDCRPEAGWLAAGLRALEAADLVQGAVRPEDGPLGPFDRSLWVTENVGLWQTANLFVTRELFERVGGFEDWLVPRDGKGLGEDVLFGWRAVRAGARPGFAEGARVRHAVFHRSAQEYVAERRRLERFPALAAGVPELRATMFWRSWFLSRSSAELDAAAAGLALGLLLRRRAPLALGAPYAHRTARRAADAGVGAAAAGVAADVVGAYALVRGSIRARSLLL